MRLDALEEDKGVVGLRLVLTAPVFSSASVVGLVKCSVTLVMIDASFFFNNCMKENPGVTKERGSLSSTKGMRTLFSFFRSWICFVCSASVAENRELSVSATTCDLMFLISSSKAHNFFFSPASFARSVLCSSFCLISALQESQEKTLYASAEMIFN